MNTTSEPIVGIDPGTTNSLVAVWRDGKATLVPNALGRLLTPSCVSVLDDGAIVVGDAARERLQTHASQSTALFKRRMGTSHEVRLGERHFRSEELSALVPLALKADAEAYLGVPVERAVITVPAYFSDAQRKATRIAGELAGLKVERLLNETEKTLSFALDSGETKYVRSSPSMGLMVGRVVLELETPEKATEELASLSYTGDVVKPAAK